MEPITIKPYSKKVVSFHITFNIIVGAIFYFILYYILSNTYSFESFPQLLIIIFIPLVILKSIFDYVELLHHHFLFYKDKIVVTGKNYKTLLTKDIASISSKRNLLDKLFDTHTIVLEPLLKIKHIGRNNEKYFNIQKLIKSNSNL